MKWFTRHHAGPEQALTDPVAAATHHERRALARDLHDGVSQDLYATHLALTALRDQVPESLEPAVDRLIDRQVRAMALLQAVVDRRMAPDAPVSTDVLVTSLDRLAQHELGHGTQLCRSARAPADVPAILAQHAWRSLREMVSNAVRHSGAETIDVGIEVDDQWITLRVADDGPGITPPVRASHGLMSLAARARQCDGSFQLRCREPRGTTALWRASTDGCHHDAGAKALSRA